MDKAQVLVVEDEKIIALEIQSRLITLGYAVPAIVSSGEEAIEKVAELSPDLVLMDIKLKGEMDGVEAAEQIRARFEVPVIYLTAYADETILQRAKVVEPLGYILKPFKERELSAAIEMALYKHEMEQKLAESERWLSATLRSIGDGVIATDAQGRVKFMNPVAEGLTGWKQREALGKDLAEVFNIISGETRAPVDNPVAKALREGIVVGLGNNTILIAKGGKEIPIDDSAAPIKDDKGNISGVVLAFRDITEREQAEEVLRHRVKQLIALNQASQAVNTSLELDQVLDRIVSLAGEVTGSDYASVAMVDEEGNLTRSVEIVPGVPDLEHRARPAGYTHWIVRSRQAVIVDDVAEDSTAIPLVANGAPRTINPLLMEVGIRSFAGLPLVARDRLLGVLYLHSLRPGNFRDQLPLLTTLANQAAIAVENARLYRASRRRSERLAALNAISTAAVSSLEMDTVLHQILEMTCQALDAAEGSILIRNQETGELVFALNMAEDTQVMRGQRLALGQGIAGWVAQHGQAVCVNDVRQDPRFYEGVDAATGFETRSLLCAPLKYHGRVTGVIEIVNKRQGEFGDEDLSLLKAVSSIAATALENARLYTVTRARADELALLNATGLVLTSTLDFSTVVRAALSQVQRLFRAEHVSLLQPDPRTGELCFMQTLTGTTSVEIPVRLQPGEGIAGWVLEHQRSALIGDAQDDPRFSDRVDQITGIQTHALMAVPLLTPERVIGVIEVVSTDSGIYTGNELRTLQSLASTLAVALENAQLYEELKTLLREREQAQKQLIHSEKMAALGRLAASLAHEINNPLQALHSCLELLLHRPLGEEKQRRYLEMAEDDVERLIAIMERMRDFYRPPAERWEPVDVNAVLDEILALSGKQLQQSRVTVRRELAAELPPVETIEGQLKQVFLNIVLNALDAMPGGGELAVETGQDGDRREVWISFADTGEGIPDEEIPRIFEPFYTTRPKGTGLGLAVSYSIVERHGGRIEVASQVGTGSTFTVFLPVDRGGTDAELEGGS